MKQFINYIYRKVNNIPAVILLFGIILTGILGLAHLVYYLLTKGVILVAYKLFNVSYYDRFWFVYLGIFILSIILSPRKTK